MNFKTLPLLAVLLIAASVATAQQPRVSIDTPPHGAVVEWRETIGGTVHEKPKSVWVIVHPTATRDYWVQPAGISDHKAGRWFANAYFGRPDIDSGARFQVAAVVNPVTPLREGLVFRGWPRAQAMSPVITVTRR